MLHMATYRWVSGNELWPTRCYKNYCEYSFTTVLGQRPILRFRTIQMSQDAMHIFKQSVNVSLARLTLLQAITNGKKRCSKYTGVAKRWLPYGEQIYSISSDMNERRQNDSF
jgi:hypothetical protein